VQRSPFHTIYSHGFARAAVCIPYVRVADPNFNAERTLGLAKRASDAGAAVALFPELGVSAYSNDDLFHQDVLLDATRDALAKIIDESGDLSPVLLVGAPLRFECKLFNCALVIYRGRLLGIVPKTYVPNYREFYEKPVQLGRNAVKREVSFLAGKCPLATTSFRCNELPRFLASSRSAKTCGHPSRRAPTRLASDGARQSFGEQHYHRKS
jgi:NAD+ synthase (glutamine-hydrolysing)